MRSVYWVMTVVALAGCDKKPTEKVAENVSPAIEALRFDGPMPVRFGDCAGAGVAWVSGPRPFPFTVADADAESSAVPSSAASARDGSRSAESDSALESHADADVFGGLLGGDAGMMQRPAGLGIGGSGPGERTIGNGRYGTISHSYPTGDYGRLRGRGAVPFPNTTMGQPEATGDMDKAIIRNNIKRKFQNIQYCYEKQLIVTPRLGGTVTAEFFIMPTGEVTTVKARGVDKRVSTCIADVVKKIVFPKPQGGGGVQVRIPFTFKSPSEPVRDRSRRVAVVDTPTAAGSGSAAGSRTAAESGSATTDAPAPTQRRRLFDETKLSAAAYQPGANNPLRPEHAALETCFRAASTHAGIAVIELAYDGAGKVERASVHGIDDKQLTACLTAVAKKVTRMSAATSAERCSVAFGELPLSSLPALDITADAITLGATTLTTTEAVIGQLSPDPVPAITAAITARMNSATAANSPVVFLHGPLVIRPVDTTKMKVVMRTIASVLAGGDDFVLAAQTSTISPDSTGWSLLSPIPLPIVPVPLGTGGLWSNSKPHDVSHGQPGRPHLVVQVFKDAIAVTVSTNTELVSIVRDDKAQQALAKALTEKKASSDFTNRQDIEIAIDGELTYADYVAVVRTAIAAGFTRW